MTEHPGKSLDDGLDAMKEAGHLDDWRNTNPGGNGA
jgi:hypothetical protein